MRHRLSNRRVGVWISRILLSLGVLIPGLVMVFDSGSAWLHAGSLGQVAYVLPIWAFGIAFLIGAVLIWINRFREFGYLMGVICWGTLATGYVSSLIAGTALGPLGIGYAIIINSYLWATAEAVDAKEFEEGDDAE